MGAYGAYLLNPSAYRQYFGGAASLRSLVPGPTTRELIGGASVYDSFLSTGGASGYGSVLDVIGGLGQTLIQTAFQPRPTFGGVPVPVPTVQTVPQTHPVIGAAGQLPAPTMSRPTALSPVYGPTMAQGGHGRYYPPGTKGTHQVRRGPHAGAWVKNRHRNVCNPKALRRAISRTHAFAKLAMHTIHLVHPKKHGTFGGFKRRRRK